MNLWNFSQKQDDAKAKKTPSNTHTDPSSSSILSSMNFPPPPSQSQQQQHWHSSTTQQMQTDDPMDIKPNTTTTAMTANADVASTVPSTSTVVPDNTNESIDVVTKLFARQNLHDIPSTKKDDVHAQDREQSLYDVHGVLPTQNESDDFVQEKIMELEQALLDDLESNNHQHRHDFSPNMSSASSSRKGNIGVYALLRDAVYAREAEGHYHDGYDHDHSTIKDNTMTPISFLREQYLKFLRADLFDVLKAKERFLQHLEMKLAFFGPSSLPDELKLSDLGNTEQDILRKGGLQLLPRRDRSGRGVVVSFPIIHRDYDPVYLAKVMFFLFHVASRDLELQQKGVVFIYWGIGCPVDPNGAKRAQEIKAFYASGTRLAAIHGCVEDNVAMKLMVNTALYFMDISSLTRFQSHFGSNLECRYNLMAYGIPLDVIPINDSTNEVSVQDQVAWMRRLWKAEREGEQRKEKEKWREMQHRSSSLSPSFDPAHTVPGCMSPIYQPSSDASTYESGDCNSVSDGSIAYSTIGSRADGSGAIAPPGPIDVVVGKGNLLKRFRGNVILKKMVEERADSYDSAPRGGKRAVVDEIFDDLISRGTRFLQPVGGGKVLDDLEMMEWIEVDEKIAKDRIGHGFRNIRKKTKR